MTAREVTDILTMRKSGLSLDLISAATQIDKAAVSRCITKFKQVFAELANVKDYREFRGELLDASQLMVLKSINNEEKLAAAPVNHLAYMFDVLYKSGRLESGKSTENTAIFYKKN